MVDWQVTATTIYCDSVVADVTIMVYKDWSTKCVIWEDYGEEISKDVGKTPKRKKRKLIKELRCEGQMCSRVIEYKDRLFVDEQTRK